MWIYSNYDPLNDLSKSAKRAGIVLMILGAVGIVFPTFLSFTIVIFIGWLMVAAGGVIGYFTYLTDSSEWIGWLKAFIPITIGALLITHPTIGTAAIGILLALYLLIDAFGSFSIALSLKPMRGWSFWLLNSILSFLLGIIFLIGFPFQSPWLVGIFIGISIFIEGLLLFISGKFLEV